MKKQVGPDFKTMLKRMGEHARSFKSKLDALPDNRALGQSDSQLEQIQKEYQAFAKGEFYLDFKKHFPEPASKFEKWIEKKLKTSQQLKDEKSMLIKSITSMLNKYPPLDTNDPNPKFSDILSQLTNQPTPTMEILESQLTKLRDMQETLLYKFNLRKETLLKGIDTMLNEGPDLGKETANFEHSLHLLRDETQLPIDNMVLILDLIQKELKENQAQQLIKDLEKLLEPLKKIVEPTSKFSKAPLKNLSPDDTKNFQRLKRFNEIKSSIQQGKPASAFRQDLFQMKKAIEKSMPAQPEWSRKSTKTAAQPSQTEAKDNKNRRSRGSGA